jgi:hypothetical protein
MTSISVTELLTLLSHIGSVKGRVVLEPDPNPDPGRVRVKVSPDYFFSGSGLSKSDSSLPDSGRPCGVSLLYPHFS